ncbi:MAG: metal-dependent hydrolase [Nitrospinota bacterium]|nr:metal-dependent hydrolase [Nitrospinota bacterium]
MPTPIGHALAGLAVWSMARKPASLKEAFTRENAGWAALCVLAANLPDADFINLTGGGLTVSGRYHHGLTHSIGFAILVGALAGGWAWMRRASREPGLRPMAPDPIAVFHLTSLCILTHVSLDVFSVDTYAPNGIGLPLLWPLDGSNFIVPWIDGVDRTDYFTVKSAVIIAKETLSLGALFLVVTLYAARRADIKRGASPEMAKETVTESSS